MGTGRLLLEGARVDELLHQGVVARLDRDASLAHEIEAAVADVRPVGIAVLNQARNDDRARPVGQAEPVGFAEDRAVRFVHRGVEEILRVGERGTRHPLERLAEVVGRNLSSELPAEVPAEPVGDHHEKGALGAPVAHPVLVVEPRADARLARQGAVQNRLSLSRSIAPRSCSSTGASARRSGSRSPRSVFCSASTLCGRSR